MIMKELGIDTWPHDKLRALVDEIEYKLLPDDLERPWLTPEVRAELRRRVAEADAHPEELIPWSTIRAEIFERYKP